jgi:branched-chain amino acid transport system permease protein
VTLALSEILRVSIGYSQTLGLDDGLSGIPRRNIDLGFTQVPLTTMSGYFWFLCVAFAFVAAGIWWFSFGSTGRVLRSVRQDPQRTAFLGVYVGGYRLLSFTVAGGIAALAGGLYAPWVQIVTPETANYLHSTQPMLNSLLGGAGFFWGPVVGTVLFSTLEYSTRTLAGLSEVISGGTLLIIILVAPSGVLGLVSRVFGQAPDFRSRGLADQPHFTALRDPQAAAGAAVHGGSE